jgi:hypothetical protein
MSELPKSEWKQSLNVTDFEALRSIIGDVVKPEHEDAGLLTFRFNDGTRLSFLCSDSGRLNGVVIQHGPDTPELRVERADG